jgi:hypothetical protein
VRFDLLLVSNSKLSLDLGGASFGFEEGVAGEPGIGCIRFVEVDSFEM